MRLKIFSSVPSQTTTRLGAATLAVGIGLVFSSGDAQANEVGPIDIGSRLELFVDDFLIDALTDGAQRRLHHPVPREVIMTFGRHGKPWDERIGYPAVVQDEDRVLLYYRGLRTTETGRGGEYACVLVSDDGIHFNRPELELYDLTREIPGEVMPNNVVYGGSAGHNFAPFLDENPETPAGERFKAAAWPQFSLYFSPDGFEWALWESRLIRSGHFDSQHAVFWDPLREHYVAYLRYKPAEAAEKLGLTQFRDVRMSTSDNLVDWSEPQRLQYGDDRLEQLYTSGIHLYERAPHLYLGMANRFMADRREPAIRGVNDVILMSSRDGQRFQRWAEGFIRPEIGEKFWTDRSYYPAPRMVQTSPDELSIYWQEHNRTPTVRLRRGTLRLDGMASVGAGGQEGELLTRPLIFDGDRLIINYATSGAGDLRVELADETGQTIPGFGFEESELIFGNEIEHMVVWNGESDLGALAGRPVRLRVRLRDADLFSVRFQSSEQIRQELTELVEEASTMLGLSEVEFADYLSDELQDEIGRLEDLLEEEMDAQPDWVLAGMKLRRAMHAYNGVQRAGRQAERLLNQVELPPDHEPVFGFLQSSAAELLASQLEKALQDRATGVEEITALSHRLSAALEDTRQAENLRTEALAALSGASELDGAASEGFGQVWLNSIKDRAELVTKRLQDPRVSTEKLQGAIEELSMAVAVFLEADSFPTLEIVEIPDLPATLALAGARDFSKSWWVNMEIVDNTLILSGDASLRFRGVDNEVIIEPDEKLKPDTFTVEAQVQLDQTDGQWMPLVRLGRRHQDTTDRSELAWSLRMRSADDRLEFVLGSREDGLLAVARDQDNREGLFERNQWQHVAATYDGRAVRLYVNGELADEVEYEGGIDYSWSEVLQIGGNIRDGRRDWFQGKIKEVALWDRALDGDAIARRAAAKGLTGDEEGLAGLWISGREAGTLDRVFDRTAHGHDGKIMGATWNNPTGWGLLGPFAFPEATTANRLSLAWTRGETARDEITEFKAGWSREADHLPMQWAKVQNGDALPLIKEGENIGGRYLWLKPQASSANPSSRQAILDITLAVE